MSGHLNPGGSCSVADCGRPVDGRGLCSRHYMRSKRAGTLPSFPPRIDWHVDEHGCWIWDAALASTGYGVVSIDQKPHYAHRLIFRLLRGPIPDGYDIDHLCRVHACVNPAHLEAVTHRVNVLRGTGFSAMHAVKTHCNHGHEFTEANTYHRPDAPHMRSCRQCKRDRDAARRRFACGPAHQKIAYGDRR